MKPRTTVEFLDALKVRYNLPSDYKLAKFLIIGQQTISNYRQKGHAFDDAIALKVAELLELPPGHVLACIHEERSKRPQVKAAWHQVARALAPAVLVFLAGALGAHPQITQGSDLIQAQLCILCKLLRRISAAMRSSFLGHPRRFSPFRPFPGPVFA